MDVGETNWATAPDTADNVQPSFTPRLAKEQIQRQAAEMPRTMAQVGRFADREVCK